MSNSQRVEAQPQTSTTIFGKPEAYRKESGEAAQQTNETLPHDFLCKTDIGLWTLDI
jgi:hypothetical protein